MTDGPLFVFTKKTVVDESLIRDSTNGCKSNYGFYASQFHPNSMCQALLMGLFTRWEPASESGILRQNETRNLENMILSIFQRIIQQSKAEYLYTASTQKQNDAYRVHGFCGHSDTVFEAME